MAHISLLVEMDGENYAIDVMTRSTELVEVNGDLVKAVNALRNAMGMVEPK